MDKFYKFKNNEYGGGAVLDEYKGKISIAAASQNKEGNVYKKWGYPQTRDREPMNKTIPWKVGGLDKSEMIEMLEFFLNELRAGKGGPF